MKIAAVVELSFTDNEISIRRLGFDITKRKWNQLDKYTIRRD